MLAMRVRSVIPGAARPQQYLGVVFVAVEEPGFSPANHGPFTAGVAAATGAKALFHWRAFGTAEAVPFHRSGNRESHARTSARGKPCSRFGTAEAVLSLWHSRALHRADSNRPATRFFLFLPRMNRKPVRWSLNCFPVQVRKLRGAPGGC